MKPAEPTLSIPTLLTGGSAGDAVVYTTKQGFFSDMLPVKVFMSILYSRGSQTGVHVPPGVHFDFARGALDHLTI